MNLANGCDQVWITYGSGERVAGPPVAASDDALISMIRTWAARGGQTARDFSAATPLVNVALTGSGRLTATMSVTPRPCASLRRHGQIDVTLDRLTEFGTIDATLAAFLRAAVRSPCNIIVTGGVNAGNTTLLPGLSTVARFRKSTRGACSLPTWPKPCLAQPIPELRIWLLSHCPADELLVRLCP